MKKLLIALSWLLCFPAALRAQTQPGTVDIFMGVDFNYRDFFFNNRLFDVLLNLTPGVKWNMGHRWQASAQVVVPVVNQYGDRYKNVRLNMAVLSKQMRVTDFWKMKVSGGLFSADRVGIDVNNLFIVNKWLALRAQLGFTGYCSMADGWEASTIDRLTGQAGPVVYLQRWNTEIGIRAGRFVYKDYGVICEGFRHFRHVSVGAYGSYSSKGKHPNGTKGKQDIGFKIIVMLPPYKRKAHTVNVRPATNFRLTYTKEANDYALREYITDPEQNERQSVFDRDLLPWGTDTMAPDFVVKGKEATE